MPVKMSLMKTPGENTPADAKSDRLFESGEAVIETTLDDLEQIRWALSLTPEERLAVLQDFVDTFWTPAHG
jgi:hypothetical protein